MANIMSVLMMIKLVLLLRLLGVLFISPGEISFKTGAPSKRRSVSAPHEIPPTLHNCDDDDDDNDDVELKI